MSTAIAGQLIQEALMTSGLSQRAVSDYTGIPQTTISRIANCSRAAKLPEIILIAEATGHTVAQLTGRGTTEDQVQWAARSTDGSAMEGMKKALLHFMDLDEYLTDQAIPSRS